MANNYSTEQKKAINCNRIVVQHGIIIILNGK